MSTEQWAVFLYLLALLPLLGLGYLRRRPKPAADQPRQEGADPEAEPFFAAVIQPPPVLPLSSPLVLGPARSVRLDPALRQAVREPRSRIHRGRPLTLPLSTRPLWQEKGWRRTGNGVEGNFRWGNRAWRGFLQEPYPGRYQAFIWDPPMDAIGRNTAHRACFQNKQRDGRYQVHYHTAPCSLDHAICTIEDVLGEALGLAPRQHSPG